MSRRTISGDTPPPSKAQEDWMKRGIHGKLLGTFSFRTVYNNELAIGEVYWLNDPKIVGVRHPDNSRMAVSAGWLIHRDRSTQENFDACLKEYNKKAGIKQTLKLRNRPKLKFKQRDARRSGSAGNPPQPHATARAAHPKIKLRMKPKLKLKSKR